MAKEKKNGNGWDKYGYHVLEELKELNKTTKSMQVTIGSMNTRLSKVEVKAGIIGGLGGAFVVGITLLLKLL